VLPSLFRVVREATIVEHEAVSKPQPSQPTSSECSRFEVMSTDLRTRPYSTVPQEITEGGQQPFARSTIGAGGRNLWYRGEAVAGAFVAPADPSFDTRGLQEI